jgi:hypothetical protein
MDDDTESEPVGIAVCGNCNERTDVYLTEPGLRCDTCRDEPVEPSPTYTPELRDYTDERDKEMAENVEAFNESLPEIGFDVEMQDGSTYEMDKFDAFAVMMKYGDDWNKFLPALARKTAEHFEDETEPTKFASKASWGASNHDDSKDEYDTHAELAPIVAYADLRTAKMQLGFMALSGDDEDPVSVFGLGDGEISQYGVHGRVTVEFDEETDTEYPEVDGGDQDE